MHNTKLIQILRTLNKKEVSAFEKYISSPFFNVNKQVNKLFFILKPLHPEYGQKSILREKICKKTFEGEPENIQKLRYIMTDLTKLLEDFLAYREYDKQAISKKHLLLKSLNKRDLHKHYKQHLEEAYTLQEKNPFKDISYYYSQVLLEEDAYILSSVKKHRAIDSSLQNVVDNIDRHYLSKKLKYACEIINRQNILSAEYNLPFLEATIEFLKKHSFEDVPAIAIYFQILLTLRESKKEQHYKKLKLLLTQHIDKFPQAELNDMYVFAQNYCIKQINVGNTDYLHELFDNYKILLEKKIIFDGKYIPQFDFKNIVTVALRLEEYDWVQDFILQNKINLRPDFRKNAINYNLARLHFSRKEYSGALKLLLAVEFTDVYYHLDSKALLLKTYYELDDIEPLFSLISTFKVYLRRNKLISDYQRTIYNNLIKFVNKLTRVKLGSKKPLSEIETEIAQVKEIADLTWLNNRVAELK